MVETKLAMSRQTPSPSFYLTRLEV